jgi:hypothetical protein
MAWAVACVSIFFCVHVFISRFLSSGNAVIAQIFLCEISHNSLDFISVACDYEDFQRLDPSLLASCCPSVLESVLKRPARLLHLQSLSYFSSPSFFCSTFELFRLVDLCQIAQINFTSAICSRQNENEGVLIAIIQIEQSTRNSPKNEET